MNALTSLISTGMIGWFALAALALELVLVFTGIFGSRIRRLPFVANALSGAFLILALRAALLDASSATIATWLGLGFLAHLADTFFRLRS